MYSCAMHWIALLMIIIIVQFIRIALLMISIVVQCNRIAFLMISIVAIQWN